VKSSLPAATKAEKRRFDIIKFEVGCLVHPGTPAEAHHILCEKTGNRISHAATIPLCPDCHRDTHHKKLWFRKMHGTDAQLLGRTNWLVSQFEASTIGGKV